MNVILPDVSRTETASELSPLDWVGMKGIDVPVTIEELEFKRDVHARADLQVDLPVPHVKGIHMSRLYRLLNDGLGSGLALTPQRVSGLLKDMIETHKDCSSSRARLKLCFEFLQLRDALLTDGLSGWKSYPVQLDATLIDGMFKLSVEVTVVYSSTCPCSAALSRQVVENAFRSEFNSSQGLKVDTVAKWLSENASLATPHSQRSEAKVSISLNDNASEKIGLLSIIDCIEDALATPVQTAVKRADEQAFASLNGGNLMFVEDAARRIQTALKDYSDVSVYVRHMESLHPHDAVAWSSTHT
ncbi:MAG: GTP cyclohydrolase I FolE2 [Rhizobiaceae bacterium]|nr:GTP cyclohydrolase I FolE2 [Rhizobiaceae bacterium]